MTSASERVVRDFIAAVEQRDLDRVGQCFTVDATYANIPHPPVVGPAGVRGLLGPILRRSDRVEWQIVSASFSATRAWVERVDRFWIDGTEYAVACNGVFVLDATATRLHQVRDYVDLTEWRARLGTVLDLPQ